MADGEQSPLQRAISDALAKAPRARDYYDRELQQRLKTSGKPIYDIQRGKSKNPSGILLREIAQVLDLPPDTFFSAAAGIAGEPAMVGALPSSLEDFASEHGFVFLEEIDLPLGMGASYLDGHPEVLGVVPFREDWLRGLHEGPVQRLKVTRGTGDSMQPTIFDGDYVIVDTAHRRIDDQDRIWAIAYGDLGMIRRIRKTPRGSWLLMPDNPIVRSEEVGDNEVHVIGRVAWIGRKY